MNDQTTAERYRKTLGDLAGDLRDEITSLDGAQAKAMFETAAETLEGLSHAFSDFQQKSEEAWKDDGASTDES